jgi:Gpi18-like mannosyltransferase
MSFAKRETITLIAIIAVALAARLILLPTGGYDLPSFKMLEAYVAKFGLSQAYSPESPHGGEPPVGAYPPAFPALLAFIGIFYHPDYPLTPESGWSSVIMKMPMLLADFTIGWLIYRWLRGLRVSKRLARIGFASYMLNPAIILNSAYWGGVDSLIGLSAFAAVLSAAKGGAILPSVLISLGILMKYQAAVLLPFVATIIWRRCGWQGLIKAGVAGLATALLIYLPFLTTHGFGRSFALTYGVAIGLVPCLTAHAHNLWWIVSLAMGSLYVEDTGLVLGVVSFRMLGLLALGIAVLLVSACLYFRYRPEDRPKANVRAHLLPFAYAAIVGLVFFELPTEMHENYLYLACLFSAAVAWTSRRLWVAFWILSAGSTLNMLLTDPSLASVLANINPGTGTPWRQLLDFVYVSRGVSVISNGAPVTIVNAVVLAVTSALMVVYLIQLPARRHPAKQIVAAARPSRLSSAGRGKSPKRGPSIDR